MEKDGTFRKNIPDFHDGHQVVDVTVNTLTYTRILGEKTKDHSRISFRNVIDQSCFGFPRGRNWKAFLVSDR